MPVISRIIKTKAGGEIFLVGDSLAIEKANPPSFTQQRYYVVHNGRRTEIDEDEYFKLQEYLLDLVSEEPLVTPL